MVLVSEAIPLTAAIQTGPLQARVKATPSARRYGGVFDLAVFAGEAGGEDMLPLTIIVVR